VAAADADPHEFLAGANAAFGEWGNEATFAWVFRGDAELLFLDDDDGGVVAASGITYRTIMTGQAAAIMTGSWTLPSARGEGAFSRMMETTLEIAGGRDALVLGFGRIENRSSRRFKAMRAGMLLTYYCRSISAPERAVELETLDPDPSLFPSSFVYTPEEWHTQFIARPQAHVECLGRRGGWAALVERSTEFDRVHALSHPHVLPLLAARAHAAGRRLFWYTTERPAIDCEWTEGFLATLPAASLPWRFQNGDRM
jgi:hypothetical protein